MNKTGFQSLMSRALNTILPPRCVLSGEEVEEQGMISASAWQGLDFISAPFCTCCGIPFEYEVTGETHCASCLKIPPHFKTARAALLYNDTSRDLILGFKHADKTHIVKSFAPWLKRAGADMLARADILIPVPLHYRRLVARRYNQAALIAQALGQDTDIPVLTGGLRRTRATVSQGRLNAKDRAKNVRRAFEVRPRLKTQITGKNLVLIDDVYTTGATVQECAKALLKAGASQVDVLTLARVVKS